MADPVPMAGSGRAGEDDEEQQEHQPLISRSSMPVYSSSAAQRISQPHRLQQSSSLQHNTPHAAAWPTSWQDASSWAVRDPVVAGSFTSSLLRTRHPEILDSEQACRSPQVRKESSRLPASVTENTIAADDLEEALLFDFEQDEGSAFAAPGAAGSLTPGQGSGVVAGSMLDGCASMASLSNSTLSHLRSVTKDAAGVHVQTESYLMHIEEERATSTTWQAAFNAVNILCGVGLLTTPYALAITGISSLLLLVGIGAIACYTGRLLAMCMQTSPSIRTFPDIGQAAFGRPGRVLVSLLLYSELFCCVVDFLILEGDNLSAVFPHAAVTVLGHQLTAKQTLILVAALLVLPTVWLRDMSLLSYLSVGGIFASLALLALVGWEAVAITGFPHDQPPLVTWPGVPISIGLFCFCFSGHAVFPSLYSSMRNKRHFPWLLVGSFSVVVLVYGTMAVMGALMFGPGVSENITLDMQRVAPRAVPTVLAMWLVIINPVAKIALTLAPVAMAVEELLEVRHGTWRFTAASVVLRTALLAFVVGTAIAVPFFSAVMQFIGSAMSMSISIVLPCIFFMKICAARLTKLDVVCAVSIAIFGLVSGTVSTYQAIAGIADKY